MDINEMTTKELKEAVVQSMAGASLKDMKWIYNYYSGHDEWPIISDEVKVPKYKQAAEDSLPGEGIWAGEEECPFK